MNNNDLVIIELDRPRELRYGYKALKRLVALTGKSVDEISNINLSADGLDLIEKMIYCGILSDAEKHGEVIKLEQMEDLLDLKPFDYVVSKIGEALGAAFGGNDEKNG